MRFLQRHVERRSLLRHSEANADASDGETINPVQRNVSGSFTTFRMTL